MHFRLAYDALRQIMACRRGVRADPTPGGATMQATVDSALSLLLEAGESFDDAEVRDLAEPKVPEAPLLTGQPDLKIGKPPAHHMGGSIVGLRLSTVSESVLTNWPAEMSYSRYGEYDF